jgi:hypothetical protein
MDPTAMSFNAALPCHVVALDELNSRYCLLYLLSGEVFEIRFLEDFYDL